MANDRFKSTTFAVLLEEGALEIGDGYRAKNQELGGTGLIFLRAGHVKETHIDFAGVERFHEELEPRVRNKVAKDGDAVVTTKGNSTGRTTFVSAAMPPFVYSPHLSYWRSRDSERVDGKFLRYWSKGPEFTQQLAGMKASTDMAPYLSLVDQRRLKVTLPPIAEQRAVGNVLGALDDKIELNRRTNETLEATARALFKSWFVDFDPVRAKAEGCVPGLSLETVDLFPDSFTDSELGEVPREWGRDTLAAFGTLNPEAWSTATRPPGIRYVDLSNTKWGRIEAVTRYPQADAPSRAQRVLRPGDTLVGTVRPGNGSYALVAEEGLTGSTGFAVLRPHCPEYREFVYLAATAANNIETLAHLADGGAYPAVRAEVVAATPVVRAPDQILSRFSRFTAPLLAAIAVNERGSRVLGESRDALLPKLISGELRVKDAERIVGTVA